MAIGALAVAACHKDPPRPLFERIYGLEEIPTFRIALAPDARAALARAPRELVAGQLGYGATTLDPVAIRIKGHRSLRALDAKPSFKLKLDKLVPGTHLAGQRTLTLNNMVEDPAMMREVLAYRLYRALGVAAPDAGFAEVVIDGDPAGLYAVIESIDRRFLAARFADPSGPVYEGSWGCDVFPEDVAGFEQDGGGKDVDRAALARLAAAAQGDAATLFGADSPLDVPAFLRFLAVDMFVGNFDGYRHGHNYRLYYEPTKARWYFIPWGLDRTFVKSLALDDSGGYLATRCFADRACRVAYARALREVLAEFERLHLERGVEVIAAVTADAVARDPHRPSAIRRARDQLREFLRDRPEAVRRATACLGAAGEEVDRDGDGYGCGDCDDADPTVHPGAAEACDGVDTNCDHQADDAACACTPTTIGGAGFALCPYAETFTDAAAACAARGQALATFADAGESKAVAALAHAAVDDRWWIGLDDRAAEGAFRTAAGAPPAYAGWHAHEPDNAGCNQDCAVLSADAGGTWVDTHCNERHPFVCRAP